LGSIWRSASCCCISRCTLSSWLERCAIAIGLTYSTVSGEPDNSGGGGGNGEFAKAHHLGLAPLDVEHAIDQRPHEFGLAAREHRRQLIISFSRRCSQ
jgi:hypothetical protein